mmetsp:Transcript_10217/g.25089  ORF Transcript_10217/g.25089 Transcript_10217/m.25089 type:complete len:831 (+) Transcript_10217:534-3026(+)
MEIKINYAAFHGDKSAGRRDSDPKQPGTGGDSNRNGRNRNRRGSDRNPGNSLFSQRTGAAPGLFSDVAAQAARGRRGDGEGRRDGDRSGTNAEHRNNKRERGDGRDGDRGKNNSSPLTKKQRKRERERDRKKMFDRDFDPKTQPRVCVVFRGLPGSGKTLMCNLMHNVFGGTVLTYEEIVHKYMGRIKTGVVDSLDTAWMTELDQAIENDSKRFLFVDRVHGKKEERDVVEDLLESKFVEQKKGMVLFVDLVHTADSTQQLDSGDIVYRGYSPAHVDLCAKRIQKRGSAHYTHLPGTGIKAETKSLEIVNTAAYSAEFLTMAERSRWGRYFFLSVELSPLSAVMEVVACLRSYLPDGASLIAPPERSDAAPTAAVVAATGSVLSGGGASSSTTAAGASSSSSTGEIKPKPKETTVEGDQDVDSADKQGDSETKDESKAADAAAAAGKVESVTKEDDKKTPAECGEKAEEADVDEKADGEAPDRAAAEAKSSTEDDEDQDSKGREVDEEKPEGGVAKDTSSKADAGAGADKPAEAKKEESAEQQKAPVAAVQPKLTAEKVREKLRQGLEALQQKERAWRGVTEAEICAHCKVEEEQLEANEHLVNITEVLRREEEEAALAKGRRYRREESKIRETRLCKGCWTKWNNERKEKEREEKERQEQEQKSEKRLYWEIRADDGIKDMMAKKLPGHIKMIDEPHVTLVYFGKGETEEEEASNAGVSVHVLEGLHESLLAMDGDKVELLMEKIIVAKNLVCAVVSIGDGMLLPTAKPDAEPFHITLGVADGTKPVEAGEIVRAVSTKPQSELESMEIACVTLKKPKKYAGRIQLKVG